MTSYPKNVQFTNMKINSEQDLFEINPQNPNLPSDDSELLNRLCDIDINQCNPFDIYKINKCDTLLAALKVNGGAVICKGINIGDTDACIRGTMRFHKGRFEGCNGDEWVKLDCCDEPPPPQECVKYLIDECPDGNTIVNTNYNRDYVSVDANNGFLVKAYDQTAAGTFDTAGASGSSGAGVRMMFIPGLSGSFRSGAVSSSQWDMTNVGHNSAAFGKDTQASGTGSFAVGNARGELSNTIISSGIGSFAGGDVSSGTLNSSIISSGKGSIAYGYGFSGGLIEATNNGSVALGFTDYGGKIKTTSLGGLATGCCFDSGQIVNESNGSVAFGYVASGLIDVNPLTNSGGCLAFGCATASGQIVVHDADGGFGSGFAAGEGLIYTNNMGAFSSGFAVGSGSLIATYGIASFSHGYTESAGQINTAGNGSHATGYADTGGIIETAAGGEGSRASGFAKTNGLIKNDSRGSVLHGAADLNGQITMDTADDYGGSFAFGRATDNGKIKLLGYGSYVSGYSELYGEIRSSSFGSFASGNSSGTGALISAQSTGSFSFGNVADYGQIIADSSGSHAHGYSTGTGSLIKTNQNGAFSRGYAIISGQILSDGRGSVSSGYAEGENAKITSFGDGGHAMGFAINSGAVVGASGFGAHASGYANSGQIIAIGEGTLATGATYISGQILSSGIGSLASGYADSEGQINSSSLGSLVSGYASGSGSLISAESNGAVALGCAFGSGQIKATNNGSFANGYTENSGKILSESSGTYAGGYAINGGTVQSKNFGSLSYGYSNSGTIYSRSSGSFSLGYAIDGGMVRTGDFESSLGGFAGGFAAYGGEIRSEAAGSMAYGYVNEADEITETMFGSFGSFAFGRDVSNINKYSLILGRYGTARSSTGSVFGEGSFQIAGGAGHASKATAGAGISVIIGTTAFGDNPSGVGYTDAWTNAGADYAEMFEWADGNPTAEDRVGYFAKLAKDKIEISQDNNDVLGVVGSSNGTSGVLSDTAELHWHRANKKDKFGRPIIRLSYVEKIKDVISLNRIIKTPELNAILEGLDDETMKTNLITMAQTFPEKIIVSSENKNFNIAEFINQIKSIIPTPCHVPDPIYDSHCEYIPRRARKEWSPIGLLGKVYVRDNGMCIAGEKCDCLNGIAVPGNTWKVLSRCDNDVIRIYFYNK